MIKKKIENPEQYRVSLPGVSSSDVRFYDIPKKVITEAGAKRKHGISKK
jgi:hypothetical protein